MPAVFFSLRRTKSQEVARSRLWQRAACCSCKSRTKNHSTAHVDRARLPSSRRACFCNAAGAVFVSGAELLSLGPSCCLGACPHRTNLQLETRALQSLPLLSLVAASGPFVCDPARTRVTKARGTRRRHVPKAGFGLRSSQVGSPALPQRGTARKFWRSCLAGGGSWGL